MYTRILCGPRQPYLGLGRPFWGFYVYKKNTHTHTPGTIPLYKLLGRHGNRFLLKTQQKQETNYYAHSGIRTRDSSNQAVVGLRVTPHCDRTWHITIYIYIYIYKLEKKFSRMPRHIAKVGLVVTRIWNVVSAFKKRSKIISTQSTNSRKLPQI
jgi:hypothetical protein